jgi:hypothetical protein
MRGVETRLCGVIALFCVAAGAPSQTHSVEPSARALFAKHDCYGRFKWTKISKLGDIRIGRHVYAIYNLSFTNYDTASLHGMQQVSIIKDGRIFAGSYLDVAEPMVQIRGRTVFQKRDRYATLGHPQFSFTIGPNGPPHKVLLGGQFQTLEPSI